MPLSILSAFIRVQQRTVQAHVPTRPAPCDVRLAKSAMVLMSLLSTSLAMAAGPTPMDALRNQYPAGIPWKVEIWDLKDNKLGYIEMRITNQPARSCRFGDGVRVEFVKVDLLPPTHFVGSYGVANIEDKAIEVDLVGGGVCDDYQLLGGPLAPDGSSSGYAYQLSHAGQFNHAKYRAKVQAAP